MNSRPVRWPMQIKSSRWRPEAWLIEGLSSPTDSRAICERHANEMLSKALVAGQVQRSDCQVQIPCDCVTPAAAAAASLCSRLCDRLLLPHCMAGREGFGCLAPCGFMKADRALCPHTWTVLYLTADSCPCRLRRKCTLAQHFPLLCIV